MSASVGTLCGPVCLSVRLSVIPFAHPPVRLSVSLSVRLPQGYCEAPSARLLQGYCAAPSVRLSIYHKDTVRPRLSVCPSVRLSVCPSTTRILCGPVCPSACLSIYHKDTVRPRLSICPSVCPSVRLSVYHKDTVRPRLPVCPPVRLPHGYCAAPSVRLSVYHKDTVQPRLPVCPSVRLPQGHCAAPSVHLSVCPSVYLSVRLSACPSTTRILCGPVCPSVRLSVYHKDTVRPRLSVCPSVHLPVCPSVRLSVYHKDTVRPRLSVCPSVRLSVCPSTTRILCGPVCPSVRLPQGYCAALSASSSSSSVRAAPCSNGRSTGSAATVPSHSLPPQTAADPHPALQGPPPAPTPDLRGSEPGGQTRCITQRCTVKQGQLGPTGAGVMRLLYDLLAACVARGGWLSAIWPTCSVCWPRWMAPPHPPPPRPSPTEPLPRSTWESHSDRLASSSVSGPVGQRPSSPSPHCPPGRSPRWHLVTHTVTRWQAGDTHGDTVINTHTYYKCFPLKHQTGCTVITHLSRVRTDPSGAEVRRELLPRDDPNTGTQQQNNILTHQCTSLELLSQSAWSW